MSKPKKADRPAPRLEDRAMSIGVCCENCKFCNRYYVYDEREGIEECVHLCFVDGAISPEDDEWLLETMQDARSPWFIPEATEEFRKLVRLPVNADSVAEAERFVRAEQACNHFLPMWNHDENKLV